MLAVLAVVCASTLGAATMFQDSLLYFPDKATQAELVSDRLAPWPTPQAFRGLLSEARGPARATAIVFHGNAGHAGHREYYARTLSRLGLRVILAEYPGYGPRDGALGERSMVADARQSIELAAQHYGAPLVLIGESLGAGVAAAAYAQQSSSVSAILLITPWDRLESIASHHYPLLPAKLLLRDRYDSVANLASAGCPVLIALAERDDIVPARFGVALYESLTSPKRLMVVRGAGHNDWFDRIDDLWWREAIDFLLGIQTEAR